MSEGVSAVRGQPGSAGERAALPPHEYSQTDLIDWPRGTALPDAMIAQLRETLGTLDALLASTQDDSWSAAETSPLGRDT